MKAPVRTHPTRLPSIEVSEKRGVRILHFSGGAAQSAMRVRDPIALELEYTRATLLFLLMHQAPRDLGLIGLGGGSIAKFIHHHLPQIRQTAVEIHPEVIGAARALFYLPADDARLSVRCDDGAAWVAAQDQSLDVLIVDAYDQKRIVEALASEDFYHACHRALRPGGVAVFNLWAEAGRYHLYRERIEAAFGAPVLRLPVEQGGNVVTFAQRAPVTPTENLAARLPEFASLRLELADFIARLR
jgi:spermidine synthase